MKFQDPVPEKFSETHKHKKVYTTSGDSQPPEAHIQIPGEGTVLTSDIFGILPCAKHHGDPTQIQLITTLNVGPLSHTLCGTLVPKFFAQEIPI